jgi:predicted transposase YbfD/YdcC
LVLGQGAVSEKSNEITAIPLLLRRLEPTRAPVTIDALGTSNEIAQTTIDGGADDVLALKGNWPAAYAKVENVFADPRSTLVLQSVTTNSSGVTDLRCAGSAISVSYRLQTPLCAQVVVCDSSVLPFGLRAHSALGGSRVGLVLPIIGSEARTKARNSAGGRSGGRFCVRYNAPHRPTSPVLSRPSHRSR